MSLALIAIGAAVVGLSIVIWITRTRGERILEQQSITAEALHTLWASNQQIVVFDVRQPLDLLADAEIIPGAKRIPPKEIMENPRVIRSSHTWNPFTSTRRFNQASVNLASASLTPGVGMSGKGSGSTPEP